MLPKAFRLPATTRLSRSKTITTEAFLLRYAPSPVSHFRCVVVVSKKVDKRATKRNQLRRCIIQVVSDSKNSFVLPVDLLFILRGAAAAMDPSFLQEQVLSVFKKEGLI